MGNIIERWAQEEDEQLEATMEKLYGPVLKYSLLFPSWKGPNVKVTLSILAFYSFSLILQGFMFGFSAWRVLEHFNTASMLFHHALIFGFVVSTLVFVNIDRQVIAAVHRVMASDVGTYTSGRIYDDEKIQAYENGKKKELLRFLCLPALIIAVGGGVMIVPYLKKLAQEKSSDEAHYTSGGVNLNLPIPLYYPFPTHTGILHAVGLLAEAAAVLTVAALVCCSELLLFRVAQVIIHEYKVLQHAVQNVLPNARKLHSQANPHRGSDELSEANPALQPFIGIYLRDCIRHHHRIMEISDGFETALKWPAAMGYSIGTMVIGLSLLNILAANDAGDYENLVLFFLLMLGEILNMYIISMFGEAVTTECEVLRDVLYDTDWHEWNVPNRKIMLNFQVGLNKPKIIKAGGIADLNMDTFSSIMNTSYSFFNLVKINQNKG